MPVVPRDWADPFLAQAKEDLAAAYALRNSVTECPSTFCMLIQMVYEKIAKAAIARGGNTITHSHQAAKRLFSLLKRHPIGKTLLSETATVEAFVENLEMAHPAVAKNQVPPFPQLEYPWESDGAVLCPAKDLWLAD